MVKADQALLLKMVSMIKIFIGVDHLKRIQLRSRKIVVCHLLERLRQDSINLHLI